jgi:hypothetical protein
LNGVRTGAKTPRRRVVMLEYLRVEKRGTQSRVKAVAYTIDRGNAVAVGLRDCGLRLCQQECYGRAMGYMTLPTDSTKGAWVDVPGAGAQRSDPKAGNPDDCTEPLRDTLVGHLCTLRFTNSV